MVYQIAGERRAVDMSGEFLANALRETGGVVGLITPWNFSLMSAVSKIGPALTEDEHHRALEFPARIASLRAGRRTKAAWVLRWLVVAARSATRSAVVRVSAPALARSVLIRTSPPRLARDRTPQEMPRSIHSELDHIVSQAIVIPSKMWGEMWGLESIAQIKFSKIK